MHACNYGCKICNVCNVCKVVGYASLYMCVCMYVCVNVSVEEYGMANIKRICINVITSVCM